MVCLKEGGGDARDKVERTQWGKREKSQMNELPPRGLFYFVG